MQKPFSSQSQPPCLTFYIPVSYWDLEIARVVQPLEPIPFDSMRTFCFYYYCPGDTLNTDTVATVDAAVDGAPAAVVVVAGDDAAVAVDDTAVGIPE